MGSLSLLQGIFPTEGLNPGLPCCRQTFYRLSHQASLGYLICEMKRRKNFLHLDKAKSASLYLKLKMTHDKSDNYSYHRKIQIMEGASVVREATIFLFISWPSSFFKLSCIYIHSVRLYFGGLQNHCRW